MTTVAYRDGVLATDSQGMEDGFIATHRSRKLYELPNGGHAASVGAKADTTAYIRWLGTGEGDRPHLGGSTVIVLQPDGTVVVHEYGGEYVLTEPYAAWGSGFPGAMAAMHAGCDAIRAIEIAAMIDPSTGGPVQSVACEWLTKVDALDDI
jgi:hypothetical protein